MAHTILGGTGTVGSEVVEALVARGEQVRVVTRDEQKTRTLPGGAVGVVGDLSDPACYPTLFHELDTLFLLNAVTPTELQEGLAAVNEARRAGARRVVYLSVHDAEKGPAVPHFASKLAIERALRESGVPFVILRPNNFFQNDDWMRDAVVQHGVYPQPIGAVGLSRVDVRDIAAAAANALTSPAHDGRTYAVVGPEPLTGEACARSYARALGREVRYAGDDLAAWEAQARQSLPAWMVYDFALMYEVFQREGLAATPAQLAETRAILGAEPRPFAAYVDEAVARWRT